jgi:ribose 5-phosphate isomerase B
MTVYIASDHAGFEMKNKLVSFVKGLGYEVVDMGPAAYDETDDYPDMIAPLATKISHTASVGEMNMGIILGGSGQGEAIVANRFARVRAGVINSNNFELVTLLREHNDANVISLGARFLSQEEAETAVRMFLETKFSNDPRHERRIKEIDVECK